MPNRKVVRAPRTEADLDAAANIAPADIDATVTFWRRRAPTPDRTMIDATPDRE
jgi:hypothetical protein